MISRLVKIFLDLATIKLVTVKTYKHNKHNNYDTDHQNKMSDNKSTRRSLTEHTKEK